MGQKQSLQRNGTTRDRTTKPRGMATSGKGQNKNKLIFAAIDFGTTYSGYAFSLRDALDKNPTDISTIAMRSGSTALQSSKVPTCILFDRNKEFSAFGYDAENKYCDLAFDGKHKDWYFFKHFKMSLYNTQRLNRNYTIEDELGKSMPAMDVFCESIRYLKNHMMSTIKERFIGLSDSDVFWVITVPAIWNETAKQFMHEAAIKAGIANGDLVLALEPEAASIFCMNLHFKKNENTDLSYLEAGSKYVVIDAGGGTVDIAVHSVRENRGIDELFSASGGNWGGSYVDEAFVEFLNAIFGKNVMDTFRKENTPDMLDLQRDFEGKKRDMSLLGDNRIKLRLPVSLLDLYKDENNSKTVQTSLESSALHGKVKIVGDKLGIDHSVAKTFFKRANEELLEHLKELLKMENVQSVDTLLVVGGFAESRFLKESFSTSFPEKRIIIPDDPGMSVLKGAVIFGHNPSIIKSRMSRYTYGFDIIEPLPYLHFNENNVPHEDTFIDKDGVKNVKNVFDKHVTKCQILEVDKAQWSQVYTVTGEGDIELNLYISDELDPILVTDPSCHLIGSMVVDGSDRSSIDVRVNLRFGDTTIKVEVVRHDTGKTFDTEFDCLV